MPSPEQVAAHRSWMSPEWREAEGRVVPSPEGLEIIPAVSPAKLSSVASLSRPRCVRPQAGAGMQMCLRETEAAGDPPGGGGVGGGR